MSEGDGDEVEGKRSRMSTPPPPAESDSRREAETPTVEELPPVIADQSLGGTFKLVDLAPTAHAFVCVCFQHGPPT